MSFKEMIEVDFQYPIEVWVAQKDRVAVSENLHWHDHIELLFVFSGTAVQVIEDKTFTVGPGDLIIADAGKNHTTYTDDPDIEILVARFHPKILGFSSADSLESSYILPLFRANRYRYTLDYSNPEHMRLYEWIVQLVAENNTARKGYELFIKGYLYLIISQLSRLSMISLSEDRDSPHGRIQQIRQYIAQHYNEPIRLETLSELVNVNPSYLSRLFRQKTGMTITDYLTCVRVENAYRMLACGLKTVEGAGYAVGFADPSAFWRAFKRIKGYPPSKVKQYFIK